jgi:hypothetical protein
VFAACAAVAACSAYIHRRTSRVSIRSALSVLDALPPEPSLSY